jgi:hypothetical protein
MDNTIQYNFAHDNFSLNKMVPFVTEKSIGVPDRNFFDNANKRETLFMNDIIIYKDTSKLDTIMREKLQKQHSERQ